MWKVFSHVTHLDAISAVHIMFICLKIFFFLLLDVSNERKQCNFTAYSFLLEQFRRNWRLQQDNDPKHTSNICKQFINENAPRLLEWPSNSPDVNSIENIWSVVKHKVEKKTWNIDELELFLGEEFKNTEIDVVKNCVISMKKICLSLISSKGEQIKY